eukprot:CAMPEP_0170348536 /NCGR_PEP_ID=MMETSP0116_2-20130129/75544_1 /TAXON_ID=400756 /ORGANISM="Durinskia baltica, Strain CSIRO CS-38" /LENGTH=30 /DNA_ID= /DNA_START= /DNA_END= /DNA_ORIENTATION=
MVVRVSSELMSVKWISSSSGANPFRCACPR